MRKRCLTQRTQRRRETQLIEKKQARRGAEGSKVKAHRKRAETEKGGDVKNIGAYGSSGYSEGQLKVAGNNAGNGNVFIERFPP